MRIIVENLDDWEKYFDKMKDELFDSEAFSKEFAELMRKYVHVLTGRLRASIYYRGQEVGATAPYAYVEILRGGSHDFISRAKEVLNIEDVVEEILDGI